MNVGIQSQTFSINCQRNGLRYYVRFINAFHIIQDLRINDEIELFENYSLYRRNKTFGIAYYFAPYYTKTSDKPVGIK